MRVRQLSLGLAALLLFACGEEEPAGTTGGRRDSGTDGGEDAMVPPVLDAEVADLDAAIAPPPPPQPCLAVICEAKSSKCMTYSCDDEGDECVGVAVADDTPCGDGQDNVCTNPDSCQAGACQANHEPSGTACGDQGVECHLNDQCDGAGQCGDRGLAPQGSACGDSTDSECSEPDTCSAVGVCEPNHQPADAPCGDQDEACHYNDGCDGNGQCSDQGIYTINSADDSGCGPLGGGQVSGNWRCFCGTANSCRNKATCTPEGACIQRWFDNGSLCGNGVNDACTDPDRCMDGECLPNHEPDGTACGDGTGTDCTRPDSCLGGACQSNHLSDGVSCGDPATHDCDGPDTCMAGACNPNYLEIATECGTQSSACTLPGACNASGSCLPGGHVAVGMLCGDHGHTECDGADTCDGAGMCKDNVALVGAPCGDPSTTDCDSPDSCDGNGACEWNYRPEGTLCNQPSGTCELNDTCDAQGQCADSGINTNCTVTLTGLVLTEDSDAPLPGITVGLAGTATSTTTNASGAYSLEVPLNEHIVLTYSGGTDPMSDATYWGTAMARYITLEDLSSGDVALLLDEDLAGFFMEAPGSPAVDTGKGMLWAVFRNFTGNSGEAVLLSAGHGLSLAEGSSGLVQSSSILTEQELFFLDVDPADSPTSVTPSNGCALVAPITDWPLLPHVITVVDVDCQ